MVGATESWYSRLDVADPVTVPRETSSKPGWRALRFPGLLALLGGGAMALRMFVPSPIGLADQGDGSRLMCPLSLAPTHGATAAYLSYVYPIYHVAPPNPQAPCWPYPSSQLLVLRSAMWVTRQLHLPAALDLRVVSVYWCLLTALLLLLVAAFVPFAKTGKTAVAFGLWLVLAEATFADYAVSMYSEFAGIAGIAAVAVGALYIGGTPRQRLGGLTLFTLGGLLAVTAKTQTMLLFIPLEIFALWRTVPVLGLRGQVFGRLLPAVAVALIFLPLPGMLHEQNTQLTDINRTQFVFKGLLGASPNPTADMRDLGIPASLDHFIGESWWSGLSTIVTTPEYTTVEQNISYEKLVVFLAHHPDRAWDVIRGTAHDYLAFRPTYLGTYPPSARQKPGARECRVCLLSTISNGMTTGGIVLVLLYFLAALGIGIALLTVRGYIPSARASGAVVVLLAAVAVLQYLVASFGDALENTKHMVFALFAAALIPVFAAAGLFARSTEETPMSSYHDDSEYEAVS